MFVPKNHEVTMRCPVCFNREIDVLMKFENGMHKCLKCSFTGNEADVRAMYLDIQKKFRWIEKRITMDDYAKI